MAVKYPERPAATVTLYVFPYSGCSPNTFSTWSRLPEWVEVCVIYLPGRMGRTKAPALLEWRTLASSIGDAMASACGRDRPFVIYGHSFGALLAYLTTLHLRTSGHALPGALVVGSKKAPHTFEEPPRDEALIHNFTLAQMRDYYMQHFAHGAPKGYLDMPGVVEMILPPLQADLGINQKFWWEQLSDDERAPLECDLVACRGRLDSRVSLLETKEWVQHTSASFAVREFEGNHFFVHDDQQAPALLALLTEIMAKKVARSNK